MGCWNKTCGVSGLHIMDGEEVLVFVLEQNTDFTERCYTTAFWAPVITPFYSKYNDYGGGEESSGAALPFIIAALKKNLVEVEQGENTSHDIPIKAADFDEEMFFEGVHENRLFTAGRGFGAEDSMVDFVMVRKDVVDKILAGWQKEMYVGGGQGTQGWDNNYIGYNFDTILADAKEYLDKIEEAVAERNKGMEGADENARMNTVFRFMRSTEELFPHGSKNLAAAYMRADSYRYSSLLRAKETVVDLMEKGNRELAESLLKDTLIGFYIDSFMSSTRKTWHPGGHEGSQNQDQDGYRLLCKLTTELLDKEKAEYGDEE